VSEKDDHQKTAGESQDAHEFSKAK